ncbi:histidine kinase, partial [Marivirga lumbricoides]
ENIASTISSVKINETTSKLLRESREMTEQMRSQEEEMRQNMEELQATQEEMERSQRDREDKEKIINYTNMMIELDDRFQVTSINNIASEKLKYNFSDLSGSGFEKIVESKVGFSKMKQALSEGRTASGVLKVRQKSGDSINVQFSGGVLHSQGSGSNKYLLIGAVISTEELV